MQPVFNWLSEKLLGSPLTSMHSLATDLYESTTKIHAQVEQHAFVKQLLKDGLDTASYQQYLVDLKVVYIALEKEIEINLNTEPELQKIYFSKLNRSSALDADLDSDSFKHLPRHTSEAALEYANHLSYLGKQAPILLAAHAYVRYLGDLSGGMILKRHVEKKWPDAIHFYDFSDLLKNQNIGQSLMEFKTVYKEKLDSFVVNEITRKRLMEEAYLAFEYAEKMFNAIHLSENKLSETKNKS